MRIIVASEHAGYELKELLYRYLRDQGHSVTRAGAISSAPVDYPPIAEEVAVRVTQGEFDCGILVCGTGIGVAIASGKVPGTRVALCLNDYMARMARAHNDANILCLGARVIGSGLAQAIVDAFLSTGFEGGRHVPRMEMVRALEEKYTNIRSSDRTDSAPGVGARPVGRNARKE